MFKGFVTCWTTGFITMSIGIVVLQLCNFILKDNIKVFHPAIVIVMFMIGFTISLVNILKSNDIP